MKLNNIFISFPQISVNSSYYRNRKLTQQARKARSIFLNALQAYTDQLNELSTLFNPLKHSLSLTLTFHIPKDKFFTKEGKVSRRGGDLDNKLKAPIDWLCNPKYNEDWVLSKRGYERKLYVTDSISNLNIDDQFITSLVTSKIPSKKTGISIDIEIIST